MSERVESEEIQFQLPEGILVAGKAWGDENSSINIVAIHGFLDSAASFDRIAPLLINANNNIRIVAIDLTGHGKSSHRSDRTTYGSQWIVEVLTIADAMGWSTFSIMAHSMGTGIAIMTSGAVPNRIENIILLDGIGPGSIRAQDAPFRLEKALEQRLRLLQKKPRTYDSINSLIKRMLQADSQLTENSAKLLVARSSQRVSTGLQFSHDPRLRGISTSIALTEPEVLAFIKRISCPVLVIWASYRWYPLDKNQIKVRQETFANIQVENVEGNHHVHLEHPERIYKTILSFLENKTARL